MSRGAKIGCGIVLGMLVASAILCGGLYLVARDYVVGMADDLAERRPQIEASARKTAAAGPDACVKEGLGRVSTCGDLAIPCRTEATIWTSLCLESANIPPEFCEGVPSENEIVKVSMWGLEQCQQHGYPDDGQCPQFFAKTVASACDKSP